MSEEAEAVKPVFNAKDANAIDVVRQVFLTRLRATPGFDQLQMNIFGGVFEPYVQFASHSDEQGFKRLMLDVFWALTVEGIIAPGSKKGQLDLPFFHLTNHGQRMFAEPDYQPHDPREYLRQLGQSVPNPDVTVLAYLQQALHSYAKGLFVSSTMMLGIAAERVFILLCESLLASLQDPTETSAFQKILERNAMKPKLDWLTTKLRDIQTPKRPADVPEDIDIKIPGIYNLIRYQRNEIGHPRPSPPTVSRDDTYGYLRLFPSYYGTAEKLREYFASNRV